MRYGFIYSCPSIFSGANLQKLSALHGLQQSIGNTAALLSDAPPSRLVPLSLPTSIIRAQTSLDELIGGLEKFISSCQKSNRHCGVPNRVIWVTKSKEAKRHLSKTTRLRVSLQLSLAEVMALSYQ